MHFIIGDADALPRVRYGAAIVQALGEGAAVRDYGVVVVRDGAHVDAYNMYASRFRTANTATASRHANGSGRFITATRG